MSEVRGENPEIVELDELGENEGNFGTRVARDSEEGAEFTRRFADLGVAGACDFCHRFRHRGHAPPTQRTHFRGALWLLPLCVLLRINTSYFF